MRALAAGYIASRRVYFCLFRPRESTRDLLTYFRRRQILLSFIITTYCRTHFLAALADPLSRPVLITVAAPQRAGTSQQKLLSIQHFSLTFAKLAFFESHYSTSKKLAYCETCCNIKSGFLRVDFAIVTE